MKLCAVMMQKNEGNLLSSWVDYHLNIFDKLIIIDNMSNDYNTLRALDLCKSRGCEILDGYAEFDKKGEYVTSVIQSNFGEYDWYFPLDCDEFVAVSRNDELLNDAEDVRAELSSVDAQMPLLRVNRFVYNVPYTVGGYFYPCKKLVVRDGCRIPLDKGFHLYSWEKNQDMIDSSLLYNTQIIYMHFHNRTFPEVLNSARLKLANRIKIFDRSTLESYAGDGRHLTKYFMMSEIDYMESLREPKLNLESMFSKFNLTVPFSRPFWE